MLEKCFRARLRLHKWSSLFWICNNGRQKR
jgi:hypothetical protein